MGIKKCAIIILGASGDLAERKLIPALFRLYQKKEIDNSCVIVGSGRSEFIRLRFQNKFAVDDQFKEMLYYFQGLHGLKDYIKDLGVFGKIIVFMALPPSVYASTAKILSEEGFGKETSLIIEKPFGVDYDTAKQLNKDLHLYYSEDQLFRIDHYLAKEAVQNILVFRFANSIFNTIWNSNNIESIQINALEDIGIGSRSQYFDTSGIIRDMVQNHLLQLLSLMTMEAPESLKADDIQKQKIKLLKSIEFTEWQKFQYKGYREEKGTAVNSRTETFAEIKLKIDNARWSGMPVFIRTGKAVHRKGTEIGIRFKKLPSLLFNENNKLEQNIIIFNIQPSEGIIVDLSSKIPGGNDIRITNTNMKFCFNESFEMEIPEAYQKLLLDALKGDRTLFVSAEETEIAWKKISNLLKPQEPMIYEPDGLPPENLGIKWIDFDKYTSACLD